MVFRVSAQTAEFLRETRDTTGPLVFGRRTFDQPGTGPIDLERTRVIGGAGVTHLTFRVMKWSTPDLVVTLRFKLRGVVAGRL